MCFLLKKTNGISPIYLLTDQSRPSNMAALLTYDPAANEVSIAVSQFWGHIFQRCGLRRPRRVLLSCGIGHRFFFGNNVMCHQSRFAARDPMGGLLRMGSPNCSTFTHPVFKCSLRMMHLSMMLPCGALAYLLFPMPESHLLIITLYR